MLSSIPHFTHQEEEIKYKDKNGEKGRKEEEKVNTMKLNRIRKGLLA